MRVGQVSSKRREIQGRPPVSCSRAPHGTPHVLEGQLLVNRHLGDGNANRPNCVSGGAGLGSQKRDPLHHYKDRPPPRPIPRDGARPLPGTCVQAPTQKEHWTSNSAALHSGCSQAFMNEAAGQVAPARKPLWFLPTWFPRPNKSQTNPALPTGQFRAAGQPTGCKPLTD